jgi:hypothetical protein
MGFADRTLTAKASALRRELKKAIDVRKATFRPFPVDWLSHMAIDVVRTIPYI